MVSIRLSGGGGGAIVEGIDLATDLSDDLMRQLTGALYDHRCLIIKKQYLTLK
jgi:alpha-ketoglutarate-dependent taurine dioxygenase